jgi:hypothetical protein
MAKALIGVEWLDRFPAARASGMFSGAIDLDSAKHVAVRFAARLNLDGSHPLKFLRANRDVNERHLRDASAGGDDGEHADAVDLYFIVTHGHYDNHEVQLLFDNQIDDFVGHSKDWRLGDNCNTEWLMVYGCHSIDADNVLDHLHVFRGLHLFCGAYGDMFDSFTCDEAGDDVALNMLGGSPVSDAWGDGVTDWFVTNHAMALSVERRETWDEDSPLWDDTMLMGDHLWGEGTTLPDIKPRDQFWMATSWWDGGIYG